MCSDRGRHAPPEQTLRAVITTLVQKGFNVDQVDPGTGRIKAMRPYSDPEHPQMNYHISARAQVESGESSQDSIVTLAPSEQTIAHGKTRGQPATMRSVESGIASASFYQDFFTAIERTLSDNRPGGSPAAETAAASHK
jgi:hypothetical protein